MSDNQFLIIVALATALAFIYKFQNVSSYLGRALTGATSGNGLQDAITPPFYTNFCLLIYAISIYSVYDVWNTSGMAQGVISLLVLIFGSFFIKIIIMNRISDSIISKLIYHSMVNRYANYSAKGDHVRAQAMKELVDRLSLY